MTLHWATRNITGLTWYLDTHIVDSPGLDLLHRLFDLGWINLQIPSAVHYELSNTSDKDKREVLLKMGANFLISMGPTVLDHSQLDLSVVASPHDQALIHEIHQLIWNGKSFTDDNAKAADGNAKARNRVRDTMIVQTSIRYPSGGLITQDEALLKASSRISGRFINFRILSISEAQNAALGGVAKMRRIQSLKPHDHRVRDLPEWPS